ncbi:MAG: hypothetical protein LUE98_01890 [Tannerellaceae bacterium]|nr:hypothetical protein [Tannerellaceae bacterium]
MKNLSPQEAAACLRHSGLLSVAAEKEYDLSPLLHLITGQYDPFTISERMLSLYFDFSHYLIYYPEECSTVGIHNHLYTLRLLHIAFRSMQVPTRQMINESCVTNM